MIAYLNILQTGIQSLLAVACGWGCGRWSVLQPDPTVAQVNTMVLKFCIPCLQVWLLAIKTDMRQPGSWSALLAFLTWSVGLQVLLALAQLLRQGRLNYAQLGVDSLLLTTNNTGILGPVVLMAALGPDYAALGMLATVALYFQQLPSAQLLFQLHKESAAAAAAAPVAAAPSPVISNGHGTQQQWQGEGDRQEQQSLLATAPAVCAHGRISSEAGGSGGSSLPHEEVAARHGSASAQALAKPGTAVPAKVTAASLGSQVQPLQRRCGSGDSLQQLSHRQPQEEYVFHVAQQDVQQHHHGHQQQQHACGVGQDRQSSSSLVANLLLKNPLVWTTGLSLLLSCMGSSVLLNPSSPIALQQLAFVEGLLGWFAATTAPLTLFTTGLWMYSTSTQQQQQPAQQHWQSSLQQQKQQQLTWRQMWMYLLARATLAPGFMVLVCWLMGFRGDLAHALVILALLPVAQTAFVVCKQAETGTHAVSVMMVASLLLMLPQLMVLLALLERLGVLSE